MNTRPEQRLAYIHSILAEPRLQGKLYFSIDNGSIKYVPLTVQTPITTLLAGNVLSTPKRL